MSLRAMTWAMSGRTGATGPTEVAILGVLAEHADEDGLAAFPTLDRMAERTCTSKSTVKRVLRDLEGRGLIARSANQGLALVWARDRRLSTGQPYTSRHLPVVWDLVMTDAELRRGDPDAPLHLLEAPTTSETGSARRALRSVAVVGADLRAHGEPSASGVKECACDLRAHGGPSEPRGSVCAGELRAHFEPSAPEPVDNAVVGAISEGSAVNPQPVLKEVLRTSTTTNTLAVTSPVVPATGAADAAGGGARPDDDESGAGSASEHRAAVRAVRAALPESLARRISGGPLSAAVTALLADGWTPEQAVRRVRLRGWDGAGPGLVVTFLRDLALEGPPPAEVVASGPGPRRCEEHPASEALTCLPCWSEIKTGERQPEDLGRTLIAAHVTATGPDRAHAARAVLRDAGFTTIGARR